MSSYAQGVRNGVYITRRIMQAWGLKDYQAVGFAGCWMCESCCNPGAYNKAEKNGSFKGSSANGAGYGAGLAQWSNAWKKQIQKQFNRYTPIETWTMYQQIDIVLKGCAPSFINMLKCASSASQSTDIILRGYENGSCGKSTQMRSQSSMKAYTWCKTSYVPDIGNKTFPDGYIGALTARTAWSNKILRAMGSTSQADLAGLGGMSFYDGLSSGDPNMSINAGQTNAYPIHDEYVTYNGTGGNIFSNSGDNAFAQASFVNASIGNSKQTEHTRIYSTNDSCIVLDELTLPLDSSIYDSYANKGITEDDVKKREDEQKKTDAAAVQPKDNTVAATQNISTNKSK